MPNAPPCPTSSCPTPSAELRLARLSAPGLVEDLLGGPLEIGQHKPLFPFRRENPNPFVENRRHLIAGKMLEGMGAKNNVEFPVPKGSRRESQR